VLGVGVGEDDLIYVAESASCALGDVAPCVIRTCDYATEAARQQQLGESCGLPCFAMRDAKKICKGRLPIVDSGGACRSQ
jgi:hypothetical protein